ncbi:uncharacterized protein LOC116174433 isoform X1 [Photinus pyralis]|nr:uncharacterized protein LOC116174433 isoform X1 [Photinus pyralis]
MQNVILNNEICDDVDDINPSEDVPFSSPKLEIYSDSDVLSESEVNHYSESDHEYTNAIGDSKGDSEASLQDALARWTIENNISHAAVNSMLKILHRFGHSNLPADVRTLMKTRSASQFEICSRSGGQYVHFGILPGLLRSTEVYFDNLPSDLKIDINIDGLPLSKSSGSQFWPIMAAISSDKFYSKPFLVGCYHGNNKPTDVNDYLRPLVDDAKDILHNGIFIGGKRICVKLNAIICDAPAKSFISCIKNHTGYFGCSKCIQEGDFIANRVTYPELNCTLRTDASFSAKIQAEHHKGISCLEELQIGMVSQIPIDYMHLVCLGIMKRLLQFWVKGKMNVRLKGDALDYASNKLIGMKSCITTEFARKPRGLHEIDRWKATELRQFLLYTGPVVLKDVLPHTYYEHFISLSVAIRILADKDLCITLNDYAHSLLVWFVRHYGTLYGQEFLTYNVHNLSHISNDVKIFGPLDNFSSFKYENYMYKIKQKLKQSGRPLQQLRNRIKEEQELPLKTDICKNYPVIHKDKNNCVNSLDFKHFNISTKEANNCCLLHDGSIAIITNISHENGDAILTVNQYKHFKPHYESPCDSRKVGISIIDKSRMTQTVKISANTIRKKCIIINNVFEKNFDKNEYIVIPQIHCKE